MHELGTSAVVAAAQPAVFGFDRARGQVEDRWDAAVDAAGRMMVPPDLQDELLAAAAGPFSFALAPFAAMRGAIEAHGRARPDKVAECEFTLSREMARMAAQQHLQRTLLAVGAERTRKRFVPVASGTALAGSQADAVFKTEVQELRLERTGKRDSSFALRVKARTILVRASDGAVLLDQPVEYVSGPGLFLDWARDDSFRKVAATAYRKPAEDAVEQLKVVAAERPLLVGAGHGKASARPVARTAMRIVEPTPKAQPAVHRVNDAADLRSSIDVYSSVWLDRVDWQKPLTRNQAASGAVADVTDDFAGLSDHPNAVISAAAIAVAIPISLWRQGVAMVRGVSPATLQEGNAQLSAAVRDVKPHEALAAAVVQQLAPQTPQPVMLAKGPVPSPREFAARRNREVGAPFASVVNQPASDRRFQAPADRALDVHLVAWSCVAMEASTRPWRCAWKPRPGGRRRNSSIRSSRRKRQRMTPCSWMRMRFSRLAQRGIVVGGRRLTTQFLGGIFSLDGVHPSNTGAAATANFFIKTMNRQAAAGIPPISVRRVQRNDPLVFRDLHGRH